MAYNYRQHDAREKQDYIGSSVVKNTENAARIRQINRMSTKEGRRKARIKKRLITLGLGAVFVLIIVVGIISIVNRKPKTEETVYVAEEAATIAASTAIVEPVVEEEPEEVVTLSPEVASFNPGYEITATENTKTIVSDNVISEYAVLVDVDTGEIVAQKNADTVISPASMTKILTLLVAVENIEDFNDTFTMTIDITDYAYVNDSSILGLSVGETVPLTDLLYGTILPSGADAALALATYVSGSQEEFVKLMNEKVEELGLSDTAHFTNVVGIYDEDHHCTVSDMAMILKAALENDICREVLSAHVYTTTSTTEHPDGITVSNWFLRRIEDKDTHGEVLCAKTGFVNQSGSCAASYQISNDGGHYICVTAKSTSSWRCIYDQVEIYDLYNN
ncbi:MAG: serine hydrolase [Butyrivibrio sp.]|nr:serine hydrolase [Butyrivibrio sp.]